MVAGDHGVAGRAPHDELVRGEVQLAREEGIELGDPEGLAPADLGAAQSRELREMGDGLDGGDQMDLAGLAEVKTI
jgi:hypothetical protein